MAAQRPRSVMYVSDCELKRRAGFTRVFVRLCVCLQTYIAGGGRIDLNLGVGVLEGEVHYLGAEGH